MNGKNQKKLNIAALLRKNIISLSVIFISIVALFSVTSAWLTRTSLANLVRADAFKLRHEASVMAQNFNVKTYYLDADEKWTLITEDYIRNEDKLIDWKTVWDENSAILVPGKRTEFKTVIKNLSSNTQKATVFMTGISLEKELKGMVKFGAYEPDSVVYESSDETLFYDYTDTDGSEWVTSKTLNLNSGDVIPAGGELTIRWYASINTDVQGGCFPALMSGENYIKTGSNYYSVNKLDGSGHVTQAYECNDRGELVLVNGQLVEYTGDYSSVTFDYKTFGNADAKVRISGLYIAVG